MDTTDARTVNAGLFVARTAGRSLIIDAVDAGTGSRIGGRPPGTVVPAARCGRCGAALEYLLTLAADVLTEDIARGQALSVTFCRDADCRMNSHAVVRPSALTVLVHDDGPRAPGPTELDSGTPGRRILPGPVVDDPADAAGVVRTDDSKLGGRPGFLQDWGSDEADKVTSAGCGFLFQFSELSYPAGLKVPRYVFLAGVVYVYCRIDPKTGLPLLRDFAAFWQNT